MKTIKDTANNTMQNRGKAPVQPLDILAETPPGDHNQLQEERVAISNKAWNNIPSQAQKAELAHVEVYLDNFIGVFQGVQTDCTQITRQFFHSIGELLNPNNPTYVARK